MRLLCVLSLTLTLTGCLRDSVFVGPSPDEAVYSFALTEDTPAFASADDGSFFLVETRVELPIEIPTEEELADLQGQGIEPYGRMPWVRALDMGIEVDLSITNLMDERRLVTVSANGITEFHEYVPGVTIVDDDVVPNFNQWERSVSLDAGETFFWTIREEAFDEVAIDLATIANGAPNPNQVVYFENQSATDIRAQPFIPEVIAGLVGFRLGLGATSASNIVLEASVRVRDQEGRLADPQDMDTWWELPPPAIIMGTPMMMMP